MDIQLLVILGERVKRILIIITLLSSIFASCTFPQLSTAQEDDNVVSVSNDDIEMNHAIKNAQDSLPQFITAFISPTGSQTYFSIKGMFRFGYPDDIEHMWVSDLSFHETHFIGFLGNDPVFVEDLKYGDQVKVSLDQISDWMIVDGETLLGGFTIHVLRNKMSLEEKNQFDESIGLTIPDEPLLP